MNESKKSGLAVASLVLGIIGVCFSIIPIINNASFIMGIIGLVFGIIGLIKKNKKGLAIAGIILCILAMAVTLAAQSAASKALNQASSSLNDISGDNTAEILGKDVSVDIGEFVMSDDAYGITKSSLPVTVTNLMSESKTYSIQIEAVDASENRIEDAYINANELGAGQSQSFEEFTYVSSDNKEAMKTATFKVVKVSKI